MRITEDERKAWLDYLDGEGDKPDTVFPELTEEDELRVQSMFLEQTHPGSSPLRRRLAEKLMTAPRLLPEQVDAMFDRALLAFTAKTVRDCKAEAIRQMGEKKGDELRTVMGQYKQLLAWEKVNLPKLRR